MQTTDAELVKRCLAGDHCAWETVVRQYQQRIYNLAKHCTGRFDEGEVILIVIGLAKVIEYFQAQSQHTRDRKEGE